MAVRHRLALLPALALLFFMAVQEGAAHRLLSTPDAATAHATSSSALCATTISSYEVKSGDTPKTVVTAAYPDSLVHWGKLWGMIRACNAAAANSGKPGNPLLAAGTSLTIPAIPDRLTKAYDNKPDDDSKPEHPALKHLCGCTADIRVTTLSTWLDLVTAAFPGLQPAAFAANILAMCNRGAKFVEGSNKKLLAADQTLRSICLTIKGKTFADFLNDAHQQADKVKAEIAASEATAGAVPPATAAAVVSRDTADDNVSTAQTTCTINTALSTAAVRDVTLTNSCPVYTNGCSGPSDVLSYQAQLTPCCQAHDWCYSCAYRAGWTGSTGRGNCDYLFWDNLYRACDFWYPSDFLNRGACKTTADSMYTAVSVGGGSAFNNNDLCPGESWKLANTNFCFNPVYSLNSLVSYIKPGNGQQWGTWTNYAQCPLGSWVTALALRVEPKLGWSRDDTALNAVKVRCSARNGTQMANELLPGGGGGNFGSWTGYATCPTGRHITAVRMQVEGSQGASDDTAANNVQARCSDGTTVLQHGSSSWGNWGSWSGWVGCPANTAVCAFRIRIEQAGAADCTSMNDLEVACCSKD